MGVFFLFSGHSPPPPPLWPGFSFPVVIGCVFFCTCPEGKKEKVLVIQYIKKAKGLLEFAYTGRVLVMEYHDRMELQGFGDVF
jgi:hypothetical protein